jgi:hypothetical protein
MRRTLPKILLLIIIITTNIPSLKRRIHREDMNKPESNEVVNYGYTEEAKCQVGDSERNRKQTQDYECVSSTYGCLMPGPSGARMRARSVPCKR